MQQPNLHLREIAVDFIVDQFFARHVLLTDGEFAKYAKSRGYYGSPEQLSYVAQSLDITSDEAQEAHTNMLRVRRRRYT